MTDQDDQTQREPKEGETAAIERVRAAFGDPKPNDYLLKPLAHADALAAQRETLGTLAEALRDQQLREIAATFDEEDARAGWYQRLYRRLAVGAILLMFVPVALGAFPILIEEGTLAGLGEAALGPSWSDERMKNLFLAIQFLALGLSLLFTMLLRVVDPFERWMRARAEAEAKRLDYFDEAFRLDIEKPADNSPTLLIKLEYFRRFQLDIQRNYYRSKGLQNKRLAERNNAARMLNASLILFAAAPTAFATYATVFDAADTLNAVGPESVYAAIGLFGAAIGNLLFAMSMLDVRRRNAKKFLNSADMLDELYDKPLAAARLAAARSDEAAVQTFVRQIHDEVQAEHKEWLSLQRTRQRIEAMVSEGMPSLKFRKPKIG